MRKKILIDLANQQVTALEGAKIIRQCECVSGDSSHPTPTGTFRINRKEHPYTSKKYGARMDYAMFFTNSGEALHQYHGPAPWWLLRAGRSVTALVGSHGCVRMQEDDAKALYKWASIHTLVEVT
jgi:lipoprotein-anchoring transpeptidase ErfK/SrfK